MATSKSSFTGPRCIAADNRRCWGFTPTCCADHIGGQADQQEWATVFIRFGGATSEFWRSRSCHLGLRSIGKIGGEAPDWMVPNSSNPCRS